MDFVTDVLTPTTPSLGALFPGATQFGLRAVRQQIRNNKLREARDFQLLMNRIYSHNAHEKRLSPIVDKRLHSLARGDDSATQDLIENKAQIMEECGSGESSAALTELCTEDDENPLAKAGDRRQLPELTTTVLYQLFYDSPTILTCHGKKGHEPLRPLKELDCYLRLDGQWATFGDENHDFVDSVIARKGEFSEGRANIRFQLPFQDQEHSNNKAITDAPDQNNVREPGRLEKRVGFAGVDESKDPPDELIVDFCETIETIINLTGQRVPIRLVGKVPHHCFYELDPEHGSDCARNRLPVSLETALAEPALLSAKSKVYLAFALAKSYWQFYESKWMQVQWSLTTICLLSHLDQNDRGPAGGDYLEEEAKTPYLTITSPPTSEICFQEHEPPETKSCFKHPYPYLLNLGILLFLLCAPERFSAQNIQKTDKPGTQNKILCDYIDAMRRPATSWPDLDLSEQNRNSYKQIVQHCIPGLDVLKNGMELDTVAARRAFIRDMVVYPLYQLLKGMESPSVVHAQPRLHLANTHTNATSGGKTDLVERVASEESRTWLDAIKFSHLVTGIRQGILKTGKSRPMIAVLDTGYDPKSSFIGPLQRKRFTRHAEDHELYHWKDFWGDKSDPEDKDGHGTSMLSTIMALAPFADVCVARIAGEDSDLRGEQRGEVITSLKKAIIWACDTQKADIVSISLGWEKEPIDEGKKVIQNAMSMSLGNANQKVLFFAAASNYGGAHPELFPAKYKETFSVRATDTKGVHQSTNPELSDGSDVYGTLGVRVPTADRGSAESEVSRSGSSIATAITAALAAILIAFINIHDTKNKWEMVRTSEGFQKLMRSLSTKTETQKRFFSLEKILNESYH
ncbi:subtilisin-like protein, partial [Aaosphaeria arxii CBS 175.79]